MTRLFSRALSQLDTTQPLGRHELHLEICGPGGLDRGAEQAQVHAADKIRVRLGELMERTVLEHDRAALDRLRLVAEFLQCSEHGLASRPVAGGVAKASADRMTDARAVVTCDVRDRVVDVSSVGSRSVHRLGEHPARKLVVTRWE